MIGWLSGLGWKIWLGLALAGAVVMVLLGAKRAGRTAEKLKQMEKINEAVQEKNKRSAADRGLSDDALRQRLREQRDELRRILQPR